MSIYKMEIKNIMGKRNKRNKSPTDIDRLKAHISADEINSTPILKNLLNKNRRIKYSSLTNLKPHLTPINDIKEIKDKNEIKLINNIDSFRQIFYEYNKNQKVPRNNEPKVYRGNKNYNFSKIYNSIKNVESLGEKEMLEEIKEIYKNNNISLPSIDNTDKNLFSNNLLLTKENNIKNTIMFKLSSDKSNEKSMSYLKKIQKNINNKILGKQNHFLPKMQNRYNRYYKNTYIFKNIGTTKNKRESIPKSIKDINNIKETINTIDDLDYFFESNNQQYLNYLKNPKNSKMSTRVNSALYEKPVTNIYNDINIYKLSKNKIKSLDKNKENKSSFVPNDKIDNKVVVAENNINIYDYKSIKNNINILNKNNSMDNITNNNNNKISNLLKIKKINLNDKRDGSQSSKKKVKINLQKNEQLVPIKKILIKKKVKNNNQKLDLSDKFNIVPNKGKKKSIYNYSKKSLKNSKSIVEYVYDKIKEKEDYNESSNLIKKYMKIRSFSIDSKVHPIDICNGYHNVRDYLSRNDFLKKYLKLKETSGYEDTSFTNMQNEYYKYKTKLNNLADDINKIVTNL